MRKKKSNRPKSRVMFKRMDLYNVSGKKAKKISTAMETNRRKH